MRENRIFIMVKVNVVKVHFCNSHYGSLSPYLSELYTILGSEFFNTQARKADGQVN